MTAFLEPLTPEAEASLGTEKLELKAWPFRVGRESRMVLSSRGLEVRERRRADVAPSNDLYLLDSGRHLNVSRAHFEIDRIDDTTFVLRDRGSALGTFVGDTRVGGQDAGGEAGLKTGDVIVVGTSESPFVFRFLVTN